MKGRAVPVEQANAQLLFGAGNPAADTRGGDAEQASGPPEKPPASTMVTNLATPSKKSNVIE